MDNFDYPAIGQRIKLLRKRKGLNQTELAKLLGKSLRTVQKYETGEIEVSVAVVNQMADILDSTSTYILGYESSNTNIRSLADVMDFLFKLETVAGIDFKINVEKPPRSKQWECSIAFDGKNVDADFNTDLCLFLEQWEEQREDIRSFASSQEAYKKWKEQTLAYYAATSVTCQEPKELDKETRIARRNEFLAKSYDSTESD
ncbi:MAG: helix-turn-helix transcriptional regulator [Clostridiaceae bacterium]|nr:helix-turn-helix transcriptional regulator [Clostridiaceae bacterium]